MYADRLKLMFSHTSVQVMFGLWLLGWALVIGTGNARLLWLAPLGIIGQMLNEYSVHRYLFHWPAPRSQFWFDVLYRVHYGHHDFPDKPALFFVPVWFAVPMALLHVTLAYGVLRLLGFENPLIGATTFTFVGGITAFLFYEWFHMTAHTNVRKWAVERYVTRLHGMHHFRNYQRWFHVNPGGEVIDRIMGTAISNEELKQKGRMQFLSTLGLKPDDPRLISARRRLGPQYGISDPDMIRAAATI
ncbi:sterol desaturase family protein [Profundibacter sp.]